MWAFCLIVEACVALLLSIRILNYIQLDGYSLKFNKKIYGKWGAQAIAAVIGFCIALTVREISAGGILDIVAIIIQSIPLVCLIFFDVIERRKTPLVPTARIKRFYAVFLVFSMLLCSLLIYCSKLLEAPYLLLALQYATLPVQILLCMLIALPIEHYLKRKYVNDARARIASNKNMIKIGVTGSYGKTSVKNCLKEMLSAKYKVVASPESYNTPMGICKASQAISADTEIFIAEMGARKKGDIAELCDIVKPDIGILTGIAPQHLETFKSINNVVDTKFELINSLKRDGAAFFNGDDANSRKMYYKATVANKYLSKCASGYIYADDIEMGEEGTDFTLHIGDNAYDCYTKLIGNHNIANIVLSANVANYLGVDDALIVSSISDLDYTPHRMQLIKAANGMLIIDDTYNCNIAGAECALETLGAYNRRKVVATQGIVELGEKREQINMELGRKIAGVADFVIAIGINSGAIAKGLLDAGFEREKLLCAETLDKAKELFSSLLKSDDILLLMNDLPDNY